MILYEIIREDEDNKYVPIEIDDNDYYEILNILSENWSDLLNSKDEKSFNFYSEQIHKLERHLYKAKRKLYEHYRNTNEERKFRRRIHTQNYNHEYYLKVTKPKRKMIQVKTN